MHKAPWSRRRGDDCTKWCDLATSNSFDQLLMLSIGTRVPGTNYQLDPIRGAFNIGAAIRWLDFNDCFLAAECAYKRVSVTDLQVLTE